VKRARAWTHRTAVVDAGARVGAGTKVWHFCHVMAGARIGRDCVLAQNVFVAGTAIVGDGCRIQNNVSIYDGVTLEDGVFVGPSAVFTNVRTPRAFVDRRRALEQTTVERGATIGANATIVCGARIGAYAFVAAGAVVTGDVPPHAVVSGVPARRSSWICRCGATRGSAKKIRDCACHARDVVVGERRVDR
jgi:UDP-2-acetamido-3-amino-2,3-dideoxy-glucuronate N-acetyltransferase